MNNNEVMKKLRVALQLRNDEIIHILDLVDFRVTETELSAIFRAEDHTNFKPCGDQLLRNFLNGLIIHKRGAEKKEEKPKVDNSGRMPINKENRKPEINFNNPEYKTDKSASNTKKLDMKLEKRDSLIKPVIKRNKSEE